MEKPPNDFYAGEDILSHWRHYLKDATSPNSFIDMALFSVIAGALQRRVWVGQAEAPLFLNMYTGLVGKAGLGKGLVVKPAINFITWLKFNQKNTPKLLLPYNIYKKYADIEETKFLLEEPKTEIQEKASEIEDIIKQFSQREDDSGKVKGVKETALFAACPESLASFEALIMTKVTAGRRLNLTKEHHKLYPQLVPPSGIYSHNSLNVFLEDMVTLFKKHQENLINFFRVAFDCGDYENDSKKSGYQYIKGCWLNLLAGTTPHDLQGLYASGYLDGGFSSRTTFVYEEENRFNKFGAILRDESQAESKFIIIAHLHKLSKLFGPVKFSPEAWELLRIYFENILPVSRINTSPKLDDYYSRKNIITIKLAAAIHFSRNLTMTIELDSAQRALEILERLEPKMHLALQADKKENPTHHIAKEVKRILEAGGPMLFEDIWLKLEGIVDQETLCKIMEYAEKQEWISIYGIKNDKKVWWIKKKK